MSLDAKDQFCLRVSAAMWRDIGAALGLDSSIVENCLGQATASANVSTKKETTTTAEQIGKVRIGLVATMVGLTIIGGLFAAMLHTGVLSKNETIDIADEPPPLSAFAIDGASIPAFSEGSPGTEDVVQAQTHDGAIQPSLVTKKVHLIYHRGARITQQQIIDDAGIVATGPSGELVELNVAGLEDVDSLVPGRYRVSVYPPSMPMMGIDISLEIT